MAVYSVTREGAAEDEKPRVVEARTRVAAISHVARATLKAETITMKQAMALAKDGVELEEASSEVE